MPSTTEQLEFSSLEPSKLDGMVEHHRRKEDETGRVCWNMTLTA